MPRPARSGSQRLASIELFTGAGGLALGVAKAGFAHTALIELNRNAVASLNENRSRVPEMADWPHGIQPTDVHDFDFAPFRDRVALIAAGAPCQPFSLGGKHQGDEDKRNLFPAVFEAVRVVRPEAVVIENVKGLLRTTFKEYFDYITLRLGLPDVVPYADEDWRTHRDRLEELKERGKLPKFSYRVEHQLFNAADYGLPQRRERVFIIAFRSDLDLRWRKLEETHSEDALLYEQWVTGHYWKEHRISMPAVPANLINRVERLRQLPRGYLKTKRWRTVRDALRGLPKPTTKENTNFSNHVANPGARVYQGHTGSPLDVPAKTIKAGDHGVPGGENIVVNADGSVRYFTVREAARLQGFPDEYVFQGAWTEAFRQLGNAVPVTLAEVVASRVRALLDSVDLRMVSAGQRNTAGRIVEEETGLAARA